MADNIFEKLTDEEREHLWMYMIFNRDKIIEKTEQWTKEAEKRGMTLTEYLESIDPLNEANKMEVIKDVSAESEDNKVNNPMKQTLDFLKNLYLQNKEEIDRVVKEYKAIEADKAESEET